MSGRPSGFDDGYGDGFAVWDEPRKGLSREDRAYMHGIAAMGGYFHDAARDRGGLLTTATNWELAGYLSWKLTEDQLPLKGWETILRASTLFGSGEGPNGRMRTEYGGCPWPVMAMERVWHC